MGKSKIDWCDYVVNPVVGCTPISAGCKNCYAKRMTDRFEGKEAFTGYRHKELPGFELKKLV